MKSIKYHSQLEKHVVGLSLQVQQNRYVYNYLTW